MIAIMQPLAACLDHFADGDRRRMANDGNGPAVPARLDAQHAEAGLVVVERHPLDRADEMFGEG